jgi:hypothetical protein
MSEKAVKSIVTFQIFLDYGKDLSEANSFVIGYAAGTIKIEKDFTLSDYLTALRIDPSDKIGFFSGFIVRIIADGKEVCRIDGPSGLSQTRNIMLTPENGSFMSITDDPIILVPLPISKGTHVRIEAEFEFNEIHEPFTFCINSLVNRDAMKDTIINNYKRTIELKDKIINNIKGA